MTRQIFVRGQPNFNHFNVLFPYFRKYAQVKI